ncbi:unnamed protein product [Boreogadus saida]
MPRSELEIHHQLVQDLQFNRSKIRIENSLVGIPRKLFSNKNEFIDGNEFQPNSSGILSDIQQVYHCGTPRYMEPHILGWRPLMLRLIYFLFLRPSLMMSMCNLWPPLISLWPPLISLWQQHINIFLHFLLQRKTCCKSGDGGVSLSCRTSPCRLRKTDCRTENGDECKEGYRVGRPTVEIPLEAIEGYLSHCLKVQEIADMYGVHRTTIHRKMQQNGLSVSDMYSEMSDTQLDALVLEIHRIHLCGYRMLRYHLQGRGHLVQIHRVRQSLKRVDPEGTEQRALANRTLHRRQYSVPGPNCMWHIDGNHKLIRWRFVIHGGIDGFSRLVVFLSAATNNRATTVLDAFLGAVRQYGVPSRVRSDKGRENFEVAYYMVDNCGPNRNSHITGRSVHNQRIERLWRDVYTQVLDLFHTLFHEMEASWMLNPDSEIHLFALHWVFQSLVQSHLRHFQDAWNFHSLRTENSQSPYQLWLRNISAVADLPEVDGLYGASVDGPDLEDLAGVDVPEIQLPRDLTAEELSRLPQRNVSLNDAIAVYSSVVEQLHDIFQTA